MNLFSVLLFALYAGLLSLGPNPAGKTECQTKNWNHGTQQTMTVEMPAGSTTQKIIINVENLDDSKVQGTCPTSIPYPPTVENYEKRKCEPADKFADMTVEWVRHKDEGDKHTVSIEIKNGDQAPARRVKLCVRYTE